MQQVMDKERHRQEIERLKQQNQVTEENWSISKTWSAGRKAMVIEWAENNG